jgi:hypothetical protein
MYRSAILIAIGSLVIGIAAARPGNAKQTKTAPDPVATASLPNGAPIMAELTKTIDAKKAKEGEAVTARVVEDTEANGKVLVPRGAKLEGHITQVSARANGASHSSVGIVFDKAILKHGEVVPLNATVEALAAAPQPAEENTPSAGMGSEPTGATPSQGMGGRSPNGSTNPMPAPNMNGPSNTEANNASGGTAANGSLNSNGRLTPVSRGVFGMKGIGLTQSTVGTEQAAVITSTGKDVHLDSGTQLLLVTRPVNRAPKS